MCSFTTLILYFQAQLQYITLPLTQ